MTDLEDILPASSAKERRPLARRTGPARNTESLRASLDRVVDKIGLPADAGITAASLELGLTLKQARLAKGLTQAELAARIDLSQAALSGIENGRGPDGPTWTTITRICEALDIEPSFLPADAAKSAAMGDAVRIVRVSKGAKAKVREADVDKSAARAVALGLLSKSAMKWIVSALGKAALSGAKSSRATHTSRFLKLAPHTGTRITATDDALVVIAVDGDRVEVRAVTLHAGAGKTQIHDGVALVGRSGAVEVGNRSNESSLVFAVPAAQLIKDGEAISS